MPLQAVGHSGLSTLSNPGQTISRAERIKIWSDHMNALGGGSNIPDYLDLNQKTFIRLVSETLTPYIQYPETYIKEPSPISPTSNPNKGEAFTIVRPTRQKVKR